MKVKELMTREIDIVHDSAMKRFILIPDKINKEPKELYREMFERAIGVIYRSETERYSHYFYTILPRQFDIIIHIDETRALTPIERTTEWEIADFPETFPSGM